MERNLNNHSRICHLFKITNPELKEPLECRMSQAEMDFIFLIMLTEPVMKNQVTLFTNINTVPRISITKQ